MKPQRINMESEALDEFKRSLNAALEIVTCQLARKGMAEGTVTAKVKIRMMAMQDDQTGEVFYNMGFKPSVKMNIGSSDDIGVSEIGGIIMKQDRNGRPMIASQQITIDDIGQEGA